VTAGRGRAGQRRERIAELAGTRQRSPAPRRTWPAARTSRPPGTSAPVAWPPETGLWPG